VLNQLLYTKKCESKMLVTCVSYRKTFSSVSVSYNLPDIDQSIYQYFYDRSLTLLFSGFIVNINKFSKSCERACSDSNKSFECNQYKFPSDYNQFSDVKIGVQEKVFQVHKVLLSFVLTYS